VTPVLKYLIGQGLIVILCVLAAAWGASHGMATTQADPGATLAMLEDRLERVRRQPDSGPEQLALQGMVEGIRSRDAASSGAKVKHLRACLELLDRAVQADPGHAVVRAHHATLEASIPRFFRDQGSVEDDLKVIRAALQSGWVSDRQQRRLTGEERALLESALARWQGCGGGCRGGDSHVD